MADGILTTRVFDAPRRRVWQEWTEPTRFADWYGGDAEVPVESVSMDVRAGGSWRLTMFAGPDRHEVHWHGSYREVFEPALLVLTLSDRPGEADFELATIVLSDIGDQVTEMLFRQRGPMTRAQYEAATRGWSVFFDRMAERLRTG